MKITEIPLFVDTPTYEMTVTLTGVPFVLRLDYHGRQDRWYLSVFDASGNAIEKQRKARINWAMIRRSVVAGRPAGALVFFDASSDVPPGFADMGRRVHLVYIEDDTIAATEVVLAAPGV